MYLFVLRAYRRVLICYVVFWCLDALSRSSTYAGEAGGSLTSSRLWQEMRAFYELMGKFRALNVDPTEYACLKVIVLFKTGAFDILTVSY